MASVPRRTYGLPVETRGRSTASSPERDNASSSAPATPIGSSPAFGRNWKISRDWPLQSAARNAVCPSGANRALTKFPGRKVRRW
jgi:hypothetical protein